MTRVSSPGSVRRRGDAAPRSGLAAQALDALHELLRATSPHNAPPDAAAREDLDARYEALVDPLLHLAFAAMAESRGLSPAGDEASAGRSLPALLARLDADAARDADAMERRHDAGRSLNELLHALGATPLPSLSDGAVRRTLRALMTRGGDPIPFRELEVEELGAAYEQLKGFRLTRSPSPSIAPGDARRRAGAHYTSRDVSATVVQAALAPLLAAAERAAAPEAILQISVCDPAMGAGAFLVEACRQLADALLRAWTLRGAPARGDDPRGLARRLVAARCLYGADSDGLAVRLARCSLWLVTRAPEPPNGYLRHSLREGDALVGLTRAQVASFHWAPSCPIDRGRRVIDARLVRAATLRARAREAPADARRAMLREADAAIDDARLVADCVVACFFSADDERGRLRARARWLAAVEAWLDDDTGRDAIERFARDALREGGRAVRCLHWELEFPEVFSAEPGTAAEPHGPPGFRASLGNPPWVSYAGRAAQPLGARRRGWYEHAFSAFARYKNLQGLFLERIASLGGQEGRVGVVLPSSMAELSGYAPTRAALSRVFTPDEPLSTLEPEAFRGVYQPSMALLGTLRPAAPRDATRAPWPLRHKDIDDETRALLARWRAEPLPRETFGERGLQTQGEDVAHLSSSPGPPHEVPLREGRAVGAFHLGPPTLWADPSRLGARLRPAAAWRAVDVVIRQTARVTIAARSDGGAFRNTLLAGFGTAALSAEALLAWLNCSAVRWWHFCSHRDARLGMPQVKISHLRAIAAPPEGARPALHALGQRLGVRNAGIDPDEQAELDALVFDALGLDAAERARVLRDAARWR